MYACPSCGVENPDRAKFCSECGAGLGGVRPVPGEVRKTVTVLFADISGSTALGERLDPESVRHLIARYFAAMRLVIERHGGTVEKFIGDAVMAVFGLPAVHEDDALRAARSALEIEEAVEKLNADQDPRSGAEIGVRIGLNTGEVVAGTGGDDATLVTGDAVNTAARLQQAAQPGEVLLGAATLRLVRDAVVVEPLRPLSLKGKSRPVEAFRLVSFRPGVEPRARRLDAPMVGRQRELASLGQAFERTTVERTPHLFTILGAAGVGKSRLVLEFLTGIGTKPRVVRGRCLPYGDGITYWPASEIIRTAAGITEADTANAARSRIVELVAGRADGPVVARLLAQTVGLDPTAAPQEELFWAFRRLLESLGRERPLVVVVDDIHWAEPTLLDLVEHVADLSRDAAIFLLCSARPELLDDRPTWGGGKLNASAVLLEPLPVDAAYQLIDHLLPGMALPVRTRARIAEAAEGNPLFVEEFVGMLIDDGLVRLEDGGWVTGGDLGEVPIPPTIQSLLAARLDRLEPAERSVAARASVIGRSFDQAALVGISPPEESLTIPRHLVGLVRKDLLRPEGSGLTGGDAFRFRHILIRDAAYESLPKLGRADLHIRFADWLERVAGDRVGELEEILGYHLEQAYRYRERLGVLADADVLLARRAADRLVSAARKAIARTDARATVSLLSRATTLLPENDPDRNGLLVDLAIALRHVGETTRAAAVVDEVLRLARTSGDERLRADAIVADWYRLIDSGRPPGDAERDARAALDVFRSAGDERGLARAWRLLSNVHWVRGAGAAADEAITQALRHARAAGDVREEVNAYNDLSAIVVTGPTPVDEGIRRCEEILARSVGNRAVEGWMSHALAHLRARLGDFAGARELAAHSRQILEENGQLLNFAILSEVVADVELLAGDPAAACRVLQEGLDMISEFRDRSTMLSAFLSNALYADGRIEEAGRAAAQAIEGHGWDRAIGEATLGRVLAVEGRHEAAGELARAAVAHFDQTDFLTFHAGALLALAEVLRRSGQTSEAIAVAARARGVHEQKGSRVGIVLAEAVLADLRADLRRQTGAPRASSV